MTWTRAHDAWIAREVEGLTVWVNAVDGSISEFQDSSIPGYDTDPAACLRAAEAWRKKDEEVDRTVEVMLAIGRMGLPCTATLCENYPVGDIYKWKTFEGKASNRDVEPVAAALAQALIRATGGPA